MPAAKVTPAAPVDMDYRRSKRRGTVRAGFPRVATAPMWTVYVTAAMAGDGATWPLARRGDYGRANL